MSIYRVKVLISLLAMAMLAAGLGLIALVFVRTLDFSPSSILGLFSEERYLKNKNDWIESNEVVEFKLLSSEDEESIIEGINHPYSPLIKDSIYLSFSTVRGTHIGKVSNKAYEDFYLLKGDISELKVYENDLISYIRRENEFGERTFYLMYQNEIFDLYTFSNDVIPISTFYNPDQRVFYTLTYNKNNIYRVARLDLQGDFLPLYDYADGSPKTELVAIEGRKLLFQIDSDTCFQLDLDIKVQKDISCHNFASNPLKKMWLPSENDLLYIESDGSELFNHQRVLETSLRAFGQSEVLSKLIVDEDSEIIVKSFNKGSFVKDDILEVADFDLFGNYVVGEEYLYWFKDNKLYTAQLDTSTNQDEVSPVSYPEQQVFQEVELTENEFIFDLEFFVSNPSNLFIQEATDV